jgi:DegV family protein with EDD domain
MNSVRIVADGGCDLPADLVARYEITIVPVWVRFGDEMVASDSLTSDEFWRRALGETTPPGSAAPAPGAFQRAFEAVVSAGHDVVCLTLAARHSATFEAARIGAESFGQRVRVVDSGSFSLGMGLQVLATAAEAMKGAGADAVESLANNLRGRTSILFALDTMEWVRQGGRLSRIMPLVDRVARTLRVRPVVEMVDGDFRLVSIVRSTHAALERVDEEVRARMPVEMIGGAYTRGCALTAELRELLGELAPRPAAEVLVVEAGSAFAAHAGPRAMGAAVIRA